MAIDWQTRGAGRFAHEYHRLTPDQADALDAPEEPGVYPVYVDTEMAFGLAMHTPVLRGRPMKFLPVVYRTREACETHAEAWATRDRDLFWKD